MGFKNSIVMNLPINSAFSECIPIKCNTTRNQAKTSTQQIPHVDNSAWKPPLCEESGLKDNKELNFSKINLDTSMGIKCPTFMLSTSLSTMSALSTEPKLIKEHADELIVPFSITWHSDQQSTSLIPTNQNSKCNQVNFIQ